MHRLRNINPKPHFSSREGINSRCRRFGSSFAAMIAVVAAHVVAGDRSTVTGAFNKHLRGTRSSR